MSLRRILIAAILLAGAIMLTACSADPAKNPIDPNGGFWDRFFVYPLSWSMDQLAEIMWGQYGLAILGVTIVIRLAMLPLTLKQYKSSKAMQALQPEIRKIQEKYKDNKQKSQEEMMKLFQKHNVNPLAGCLPILIQMPILIALYHAIMRNQEIYEHNFLWMQLGQPDPYFVLPALAALTTYIQSKMMSSHMPNSPMKSLTLIFPVLIFVMAMGFASALPLYWIYSNLFTIVQTYFLYGGAKSKEAEAK